MHCLSGLPELQYAACWPSACGTMCPRLVMWLLYSHARLSSINATHKRCKSAALLSLQDQAAGTQSTTPAACRLDGFQQACSLHKCLFYFVHDNEIWVRRPNLHPQLHLIKQCLRRCCNI